MKYILSSTLKNILVTINMKMYENIFVITLMDMKNAFYITY
jgi:hypothetical protein